MTTPAIDQPTADAIVRIFGLDTIVDDSEYDPARGYVYHLVDGNVLIVRHDLTIALQTGEGRSLAITYYADTTDLADVRFVVAGDTVECWQENIYIGSEEIVREAI